MSDTSRSSPYEIIKEFSEGYLEGIGTGPCRLRFKTVDHWISGWEAGRKDRQTKNTAIDVYLVSINMAKRIKD